MLKPRYLVLLMALILGLDAVKFGANDLEEMMNSTFEKLVTKHHSKNSFRIQPADNVIIRLDYAKTNPNMNHNDNNTDYRIPKHRQPKYFMNFEFKDYKNPKQKEEPHQHKKSYKYFPLRGEDVKH